MHRRGDAVDVSTKEWLAWPRGTPPGMIVMRDAKKAADVDSIAPIVDHHTCRAAHTQTGDKHTHPRRCKTWRKACYWGRLNPKEGTP
jgi:hypothetical protein